jgi:hypothetical protein
MPTISQKPMIKNPNSIGRAEKIGFCFMMIVVGS